MENGRFRHRNWPFCAEIATQARSKLAMSSFKPDSSMELMRSLGPAEGRGKDSRRRRWQHTSFRASTSSLSSLQSIKSSMSSSVAMDLLFKAFAKLSQTTFHRLEALEVECLASS